MAAPPGKRPDPPAHTIRCTLSGSFQAARWANVFWFRNGSNVVPTSADFSQFVANIGQGYHTYFKDIQADECITEEVAGLYYEPNGDRLGAENAVQSAGILQGSPDAANVAACISWSIQQRYRGGHPRTYVCGMQSISRATTTTWNQPFIDAAQQAANNFHTYSNSLFLNNLQEIRMGTVSFAFKGAWRSPPVFRDYVPTSAICDARVDTQRRRLGPDVP